MTCIFMLESSFMLRLSPGLCLIRVWETCPKRFISFLWASLSRIPSLAAFQCDWDGTVSTSLFSTLSLAQLVREVLYWSSGEQADRCLSSTRVQRSVRRESQSHSASLKAIAERKLGEEGGSCCVKCVCRSASFPQVPIDQVKISIRACVSLRGFGYEAGCRKRSVFRPDLN